MKFVDRDGFAQKGFSLLSVLLAMAITGIGALTVSEVLKWSAQNQSRAMALNDLQMFKHQLLRTLSNSQAWQKTIYLNSDSNHPSLMACLRNFQPCKSGGANIKDQPFTLYDSQGQIVLNGNSLSAGFTYRMTPCTAFDSTQGNDDCPFRYELTWSAVCAAASTCVNPQVSINAKLLYSPTPKSRAVISTDRYSIMGFYPPSGDCAVKTKVYAQPGNYQFQVPTEFRQMVVEVWGGGGGAAAVRWDCTIAAGRDGEPSMFNGMVSALGGTGGRNPTRTGLHRHYACINGPCFWVAIVPFCPGNNTTWQGGSGQSNPIPGGPFPPDQNSCNADLGSVDGGMGGQIYSYNGSAAGGGGAGTPFTLAAYGVPPLGCIGSNWCNYLEYSAGDGQGGGGGLRSVATYGPTDLVPGNPVPVRIGSGGLGGVIPTGVPNVPGYLGVWPEMRGGNGAAGMVKISWW